MFGSSCNKTCTCVHGSCDNGIQGNGTCKPNSCQAGYHGDNCDITDQSCVGSPSLRCHYKARCVNDNGTDVSQRISKGGMGGLVVNLLASHRCGPGSIPGHGPYATCSRTGPGKSHCACFNGYIGNGYSCLGSVTTVTLNEQAAVTIPDIVGANGVIHGIDTVLVPTRLPETYSPSVMQALEGVKELSNFSNILAKQKDIKTKLDLCVGFYTIFAPVNDVLKSMSPKTLKYHIVTKYISPGHFFNGQEFPTMLSAANFKVKLTKSAKGKQRQQQQQQQQ
ncbi:Stabilin-1 [Exaiptasia diaphana]|nr:Stabilin-1 [Exaiptasia diaphana]